MIRISIDPAIAPVISVCIANYNGADVIETCIDSILGQIGDLAVEIIVHDDCSTDGSAGLVAARYPQANLIRSAENVGFCVSNNRMAAQARGEYLLLLNNDAALFPDAVTTLYGAAQAVERPAILGLPQYDAQTDELIDIGCLLDPFLNPVPNLNPARQDVGMVIGACLWIPKTLWTELGGFPEWFESVGEDLYLCCQARLKGCPVVAIGRSGYRHCVGKSFGGGKVLGTRLSTTRTRRALSERNKCFVMAACYPTPWFHIVFPVHMLLLTVEGLALAMVKRDHRLWRDIYVACWVALWRQRATLRFARQTSQASRVAATDFFSVFSVIPYKLTMFVRHGFPEVK